MVGRFLVIGGRKTSKQLRCWKISRDGLIVLGGNLQISTTPDATQESHLFLIELLSPVGPQRTVSKPSTFRRAIMIWVSGLY